MNLQWRLALVLAALGCFVLQSTLPAGDKKKPDEEKKKREPAKDIVVDGELVNADLKDKVFGQSFCKTYTFKMEKDRLYHINLVSKSFSPYLRLENAAGDQVDAAGAQADGAHVFYRPAKTDDFQIVAISQNGGAMGKFTLIVKEIPGDDGKPIEVKNDKGKGSYTGNLLKSDPAYKGGKKHKMLLFQMEAGKTYQIDMTSGAFDSYLFLESPDGKYITQDDDGGGYPSARIIHKATETGLHRIACTYFGGGAAGQFNVTIRQND